MSDFSMRIAIVALLLTAVRPASSDEPHKSPAKTLPPLLGPGFMIQISEKPLLFMVSADPPRLRFSGKGFRPKLGSGVFRSVVASSVPAALQGLLGTRVDMYAGSGKVCRGVVKEFVFVNREQEIPVEDKSSNTRSHEGESIPVKLFAADKEDSRASDEKKEELPISPKMWRTVPRRAEWNNAGGLALTVRVEPEAACEPLSLVWARQASLPAVEVYATADADGELKKVVKNEAQRLFVAMKSRFKECEDCAKAKSWPEFIRKNTDGHLFVGPNSGRRIITATTGGREYGACSNIGNAALFEVEANKTSLRQISKMEDTPTTVSAAVDLDGDGWPELVESDGFLSSYIDGTVILRSNGGRYDQSEWYTVLPGDCSE